MTQTDEEKIKEVLGILEKKIKDYEYDWKEFRGTKQWAEASRFRHMKELLEGVYTAAVNNARSTIVYDFDLKDRAYALIRKFGN